MAVIIKFMLIMTPKLLSGNKFVHNGLKS